MKKFLIIAALFCATLLRAACLPFGESDQFITSSSALAMAYYKAMDLCDEKEYSYFVFRNIEVKGPGDLSIQLQGPQDLDADLIRETIKENPPPLTDIEIDFEIYCFFEKPDLEVAAMDVAAFQQFIKSFQQPVEKVEGTRVIGVSTVEELNQHLATSKLPVLVDFYSESCPPCRSLAPQYDQFSKDLEGKGIFLKVNISEAQELREKYEIESIPTLLVFKEAKLVDRAVGLPSILEILNSL